MAAKKLNEVPESFDEDDDGGAEGSRTKKVRGTKKGPPFGNKNASKSKPWAEAIRLALARHNQRLSADGSGFEVKRGGALEFLAARIVDAAINRMDWDAIHEIANRLDGKPKQSTEITGADESAIRLEVIDNAATSARQKIAQLLAQAVTEDASQLTH